MDREAFRSLTAQLVLNALLSLGLILPLLRVLGLLGSAVPACALAMLISTVMAVRPLNRHTRLWIPAAALAGIVVWAVLGGADTFIEVMRGIVLHISGLTAALPLIAGQAALVIALFISLLSCLVTSREVGAVPCDVLVILVLLTLWLSDCGSAIPYTIPALIAALTLTAVSGHEETEPFTVLPWMAAVAVAACLLVPQSGVTVAPLKEAADTLRQRIYDYLFFTEPRNVFSLANEGWYPQGANQLGGPVQPNENGVMVVQTTKKTYLRGAIKDTYTGRTWLDTLGSKRCLWVSRSLRSDRRAIFNEDLPPESLSGASMLNEIQVTVTMLADGTSSLLVPQRIRALNVSGDMVPYFNRASEVFITRDLAIGDTYSVTAPLMTAGDAGL